MFGWGHVLVSHIAFTSERLLRKIKLISVYTRLSIAKVTREINCTYSRARSYNISVVVPHYIGQRRSESSLLVINSDLRVALLSDRLSNQRGTIPELCDMRSLLTHKHLTHVIHVIHVDVSHLLQIDIHLIVHNIILW